MLQDGSLENCLAEAADRCKSQNLQRVGKRRGCWDSENFQPYVGLTTMQATGIFSAGGEHSLFSRVRKEFGLHGDPRVLTVSATFYDKGAGIAAHRDKEYPGSP